MHAALSWAWLSSVHNGTMINILMLQSLDTLKLVRQ
jgi:hypothetical protein